MAKRQRDWARRAKAALIAELGGCCAECGSVEALTIDHVFRRNYRLEKLEFSARISRYRAEARQGIVQVLCLSCNSAKGRPELFAPVLQLSTATEAPF